MKRKIKQRIKEDFTVNSAEVKERVSLECNNCFKEINRCDNCGKYFVIGNSIICMETQSIFGNLHFCNNKCYKKYKEE